MSTHPFIIAPLNEFNVQIVLLHSSIPVKRARAASNLSTSVLTIKQVAGGSHAIKSNVFAWKVCRKATMAEVSVREQVTGHKTAYNRRDHESIL
jgi:hypothetical protein